MKTNIVNPWYYNPKIIRNIDQFINKHDIKSIYLDMDGVLIHSCQAICDMINKRRGTKFTGNEVLSWNFREICPNLTDNDVEKLFADPIFFRYVKWIDGALEFIKHYEDYINIKIITKGTVTNLHYKERFLKKYDIDPHNLLGLYLNMSKSCIDMSNGLFIDDCTDNLNDSNAKYKIMFKEYNDNQEREWQKDWNGLVMYSWK